MGSIHLSLSTNLLKFCTEVSPIKTFVETGYSQGDTAESVAPYFDEVYSVALSYELHAQVSKRFAKCPNIRIEHVKSPKFLTDRMEEFSGKPVLFGLDAQCSHDDQTVGAALQTPVLQELEAIKSLHPASIILIDDARLYLCAPHEFHFASDWPDIDDLVRRLYQLSECHRLIVLDDVIVFYPRDLRGQFSEFARENGVSWRNLVSGSKIADKLFSKVIAKKREKLEEPPSDDRKMDISVVIPTLNCIKLLPGHLESIEPWISRVNEVIVVDSHSSDGTFEALNRYLDHPNLKILTRPRGLYQSWNFGIAQTKSKFVYVSTVGDSIDRDHLELLEDLALKSNADVIISPPRFIDEEGLDVEYEQWPIHSIIKTHPETNEIQLGPLSAFLFSAANIPCSILGSSASNLYRGDYLRKRPFPEDCMVIGDTAWSLLHAIDAKFYVTKKVGSTFRFHSDPPELSESGALYKIITKLIGEAERIATDLQANGVTTEKEHSLILTIIRSYRAVPNAREKFTSARRNRVLPWFFSKTSRELRTIKKVVMDDFLQAQKFLLETLKSNR